MPSAIKKQVRFAYKNTSYPAPPPMTAVPPLSYSVSTATSSGGHRTPPTPAITIPSHSSYYPAPKSAPVYAPPRPSSSSRSSGHIRPHYYLESGGIVWDFLDHPSAIIRNGHRLSSRALVEPATEPAMRYITIVSSHLPWTFKVHASNGRYVTLEDVFETIHRSLRTNITQSEFASFSSEKDQRRATRAYEERYRRQRSTKMYEEEKRAGMKRIDFLMNRTRFVGIYNSGRRPDEWHLSVT